MAASLKIKFDPSQDYQLEAVESVMRLFEGLPRRSSEFRLGDEIAPNWPLEEDLPEDLLLKNVQATQARNAITLPTMQLDLEVDKGLGLIGTQTAHYPSFTVEMETGTGKTYVYLRTLYELRRQYGFGKFIIVVPSIAIYEGVVKNFEITRDHFRSLYGNEVVNLVRYDGAQLSRLRGFATSTFAEIMVMTVQAFNKVTNNLYKASEKLPGERRPYQFIQETRPILVLDEPQNMGSELSKTALRTLNPLFALRYSATHRETPNLVYRLTPYQAFERNLVKKIQIAGVTEREDANEAFLALESISRRGVITAKLRTLVTEKGRTRNATVTLKHGDDLHVKTSRPEHKGRYKVAEIHAGEGYVEFENGVRLRLNEAMAPDRPRVFQTQIEETLKQHFEQQERLQPQGIKILSLFFIDRVANYIDDNGLVRRLFDQAFNKLKKDYPAFAGLKPEQVRQGYFAKKKVKGSDDEVAIDTDGRNKEQIEAEKAAFALIMRDKERLLSFDEPVAFIFAHSALKEGWDNPNVFQICSLNQAVSEVRRRQEIGRGMRLCVNQEGERVFGDEVNVLTVVANESYSAYAEGLQQEYRDDDLLAPPAPTNAHRKAATRNDRIFKAAPDFRAFWKRLTQTLRYRIELNTLALIEACVERLNNQTLPEPIIEVTTGEFAPTHYQLKLERVDNRGAWFQVEITRTDGEKLIAQKPLQKSENLADKVDDDILSPFKVVEISGQGNQAKVTFGNGVELAVGGTFSFGGKPGRILRERATLVPDTKYPVFNLIDRAAHETGLTRSTLVTIFKQMKPEKKGLIFRNPEGFAGVFITEIRNAVADQVAETIIFEADVAAPTLPELESLFPKSRTFPQRELLEAGERGLYDLVQTDSAVESEFVALLKNDDKIALFFKFPAAFKIRLPRLIGNYNPDWGIVRRRDDGRYTVYLVRETKGGQLDTLRFPHERRKVRCAQAYFDELGIDYRQVEPGTFVNWWQLNAELGTQPKLPTGKQ